MTSKHTTLTEEEQSAFALRPEFSRAVDEATHVLGIKRKDMRVLDWGCGRGRVILKLLEMGIDAYGVDIDPGPLAKGENLFRARGEDPKRRLQLLESDGRAPFPDRHFHLVLSDQVFEHVRDLDAVAAELRRITTPEGMGLHLFPAKWQLVEPHLFVPFVHWLPKNRLRRWYLRAMLDRIPVWEGLENKTTDERIQVYYDYSVHKTYYRSLRHIRRSLESVGLEVHLAPPMRRLRRLLRWAGPLGHHAWTTWHNHFREVALLTRLW